jgi:sugar phosphate isomerase/epimerase
VVIGEDKVNWRDLFAFSETKGGTQWYVLEHESSSDPLKAVTRSFEALKKMDKV